MILTIVTITACRPSSDGTVNDAESIRITSAMKNVMWKGELYGKITMDTVASQKGIYGVGPLEGLRGEITIMDSKVYVSRVLKDGTPKVTIDQNVKAPFFVQAKVNTWDTIALPSSIHTIDQLDQYLNKSTKKVKRPFVFRLNGIINRGKYHIQNLPPNTKVNSPEEAHSGQVKYDINNLPVDILGFFSTNHKGIFTHHDTNVHLHMLSKDLEHMGHLDEAYFGEMELMIGKN